jgi:hypothetical protein
MRNVGRFRTTLLGVSSCDITRASHRRFVATDGSAMVRGTVHAVRSRRAEALHVINLPFRT